MSGDGTTATATAAFDADGWYEGTHPDDFDVIARCLAEQAKALPINPKEFRRPTPEPQWGRAQRRAIEQQWADRVLNVLANARVDVTVRQSIEQLVRHQVRRPGS